MSEFVFVVKTRPVAGGDAAYNEWYDNRHVPDVLAVPGVVAARRYRAEGEGRQYLALYRLETENPQAVLAEIATRAGTDLMPMSPALDMTSVDAVLYAALGEWQVASEEPGGH